MEIKMWELKVCRVCLIAGVKMYDIHGHTISKYYEIITGQNVRNMVKSSVYLCYECFALLRKYSLFRQRSLSAQDVLLNLQIAGQVTENDIKENDRQRAKLVSNLVYYSIPPETYCNFVYGDNEQVKIKEECGNIQKQHTEEIIHEDFLMDVDGVKQEEDYENFMPLQSPKPASSDDDQPLALSRNNKEMKKHKAKSDKKKEKKLSKRKKKESSVIKEEILDIPIDQFIAEDTTVEDAIEFSEINDADAISEEVSIKHKLEETSKPKEKKRRGPRPHPSGLTQDEVDMEEYVTIIKLSLEEQLEEIEKRQQSSNYLCAPFKCTVCFKGFIDTDAFKNHMYKHEPRAGDVECPVCKFRFASRRTLQKHTANHEKKYACKSCPYVSKTTTQAKQHQKWHKGVTYKCQYCNEVSTKWTSYLSHVRIKHPSQFICGICGYSFVSRLGLAMHKTMMHKDVVAEIGEAGTDSNSGPYCKECDVQFISLEAWKRHMVTSAKHRTSNDFGNGCRVCGETFKTAEDLRLHHRKMHARKRPKNYGKKQSDIIWPIKCEHCQEEIDNARDYWTHFRRLHPDKKYPIQKSYICEICGKSFRGNAFLVYHKRTHFEERAYKCAQCPKSFFNRTNLQMHEKTHSDDRPYPCSVCFKAFKLKGALDRHFRSHTGVKPYECELCGKAFGQSNSRKLHVRTVHLKQPAPYVSRTRLERRRQLDAVKTAGAATTATALTAHHPQFPY